MFERLPCPFSTATDASNKCSPCEEARIVAKPGQLPGNLPMPSSSFSHDHGFVSSEHNLIMFRALGGDFLNSEVFQRYFCCHSETKPASCSYLSKLALLRVNALAIEGK